MEKLTKEQEDWLWLHRPGGPGTFSPKIVCRSCKRMRKSFEFSYPGALRCIHCDTSTKIALGFRGRLTTLLKSGKPDRRLDAYLGCSISKLKEHIEHQFEDWMSWDNWGLHTWHIDHIIPVSHFDHSDEDQVARCWHYSNLRPLCAKLNLRKHSKLDTGI